MPGRALRQKSARLIERQTVHCILPAASLVAGTWAKLVKVYRLGRVAICLNLGFLT
jgi:hypothetical protein